MTNALLAVLVSRLVAVVFTALFEAFSGTAVLVRFEVLVVTGRSAVIVSAVCFPN